MKLLPDAVLQDPYDVVVIGSGLGGLTAAALVARRGLRTLLLEHHYLPGGMCTTLRRQGISFDTGTALMYGFGEKGFNAHNSVMNELEQDIDIISHKSLLRITFEGRKITFWPDYDRFLDEITAAFPNQAEELRALYAYLYDIYTKVIAREPVIVPPTDMPPEQNLRALFRHPLALLTTVRMLNTSTESILRRFITDPDLLAFFDKLTSTYCYCTIRETPAILAATMFVDNHIGGAYYPARSPQILASTLEKALEESGGQILYRRRAKEIIIEQGTARAVRLSDDTVVRAHRIVANVTVWNLYGRLIKPEHIKPRRLEWAAKLVPTYGATVLYLGVDAAAIPPDTHPVEMLVADKRGVNSGDVTVYTSSLDDPSICPLGMHAMTVIAPSLRKWPSPWENAYHSPEYKQQKQAETERVLDQLEGAFPGLRKHIRVLDVGTPATIERYTLKNWGAVGGPKQSIGQEMLKRLHAVSEWRNLYLCGDSTVMGMGTPAVTVSGVGAANRVLRDAGLEEYRPRRFEKQYVHLVKGGPLPPLPGPSEPVSAANARRLARECEYCENPGCTAACPAHIDIANVMRRIEAGNFAGAARSLREMNPLSETCGHLCSPNPPCQLRCNRLSFSDHPVRIADLQTWVCHEAGAAGWSRGTVASGGRKVAVIGAGPAGLTCAYFLARVGHQADVYDLADMPGGGLKPSADSSVSEQVRTAVEQEIAGMLIPGIRFLRSQEFGAGLRFSEIVREHSAVYFATGEASRELVARELGVSQASLSSAELQVSGRPGVWAGGALKRGRCSTVQAVTDGRQAALSINTLLGPV